MGENKTPKYLGITTNRSNVDITTARALFAGKALGLAVNIVPKAWNCSAPETLQIVCCFNIWLTTLSNSCCLSNVFLLRAKHCYDIELMILSVSLTAAKNKKLNICLQLASGEKALKCPWKGHNSRNLWHYQ